MSRRVMYHVSNQSEWIDAALMLRDQLGWEPAVWFTTDANVAAVAGLIPDCLRYDKFDGFRGIPPGWLDASQLPVVDGPTLERLSLDEWRYVRMLDRVDTGGSFSTAERMRSFRRVLRACLGVLEITRPDTAVFSTCPHGPLDLALYSACRLVGVRTLIFTPTALPVYAYVRESIEDQPPGLLEEYAIRLQRVNAGETPALPEQVALYMSSLRSDYDSAEPWYMRAQRDVVTPTAGRPFASRVAAALAHPSRWGDYVANASRVLVPPAPVPGWQSRTMKMLGVPYEDSWMDARAWHEYRAAAKKMKDDLHREYESLVAPFNAADGPYVYVPLHYQPERTSMPNGGMYDDQTLLIDVLASAIPDGWRVVIREHPSQFSEKLFGEQGRYPGYYKDLLQRGNTTLVGVDVPPFDLLDAATVVATVTGTAGWEALARGVPVLSFGYAWYRGCEGAYAIESLDDARTALARIADGEPVRPAAVDAFAEAVMSYGSMVALNASLPAGFGPTYEQNVTSIVGALTRFDTRAGITGGEGVS